MCLTASQEPARSRCHPQGLIGDVYRYIKRIYRLCAMMLASIITLTHRRLVPGMPKSFLTCHLASATFVECIAASNKQLCNGSELNLTYISRRVNHAAGRESWSFQPLADNERGMSQLPPQRLSERRERRKYNNARRDMLRLCITA